MASKVYTIADLHPGGRLYRPLATSEEEEQNKALEAAKNAIHSLEEMRASHRRISSNLDRMDKKLEESKKAFEEINDLANKNDVRVTTKVAVAALSAGVTCLFITNLCLKYYVSQANF